MTEIIEPCEGIVLDPKITLINEVMKEVSTKIPAEFRNPFTRALNTLKRAGLVDVRQVEHIYPYYDFMLMNRVDLKTMNALCFILSQKRCGFKNRPYVEP